MTTQTKVSFREATLDDVEELKVAHLMMLIELENFGHDVASTPNNVRAFWNNVFRPAISRGEHGIWLATLFPARIIGALFVCPSQGWIELNRKTAVDWGCYVAPEHRQIGIATTLRNMAFARMRQLGFDVVVSQVRLENIAGMKSYEKVGAKPTAYEMEVTWQQAAQ